uniref:Uncharacterized protein n=1 Tax=Anopheles culicifacies TaxID=139723 RepID=A0A182M6F5_9DIPT
MSFDMAHDMEQASRQLKALKSTIEAFTMELRTGKVDPLAVKIKEEILELLWRDGNTLLAQLEAHTGTHIRRMCFISAYVDAKMALGKLKLKNGPTHFVQEFAKVNQASAMWRTPTNSAQTDISHKTVRSEHGVWCVEENTTQNYTSNEMKPSRSNIREP